MPRPTLDEATSIAKSGQYKVIPISAEILSDIKTPLECLRILKNVSRHCFMLESVEDTKKWGRYTFLGFDPKLELTCRAGKMTINSATKTQLETTDPQQHIRQILDEYKSPRLDYLPPFAGGLVGYFSYDYVKYGEPTLNLDAQDAENFNDVDLMLFDKVIAFDNFTQKIIVMVNIKTENLETEYNKGVMELNSLINLIKTGAPAPCQPSRIKSDFKMLLNETQFCQMVEKAKEHIKEGDIFQVVLSNRLEADFEGSLLDTY
ncbi:MAG: chorismate-binding protein, partial [Treponema sp.]|nr:chorismate-binding protein [Treponema sp.]